MWLLAGSDECCHPRDEESGEGWTVEAKGVASVYAALLLSHE